MVINGVRLPNRVVHLELDELQPCYDAIRLLQVRGAPAIGIFAGYAMYVLAAHYPELSYDRFCEKFHADKEYLNSSRPTAVNLSWALNRMEKVVLDHKDLAVPEIVSLLKQIMQMLL
jgi:methylthioribose-1-phosphate isomerase